VTDSSLELKPGARIGTEYTVEERLSRGAMGTVYRARTRDGSAVAIKRLIDPSQSARFEIEGQLLARLHHPRVVAVVEHLIENGSQYLVMELVEGLDLNRILLDRGDPGLPLAEVLECAAQAAEALEYVHAQNIVHRDVKPHNLIRGDGGVVLVDFGIAREQAVGDAGTRALGTPLYMAPEVLVGEEVSPRSDVYSLAASVWALLAGKPPAYDDPKRLAQTVKDVSPALEGVLRAALEIRPERRLASVAALAAGLGLPLDPTGGRSLAVSVAKPAVRSDLLEAIVRTTASVFEAAAASVALVDQATGDLVYEAAWGIGAEEIVGVHLAPGGGIAGSVIASSEAVAIPDCRSDPRFAESIARKTGYVPHTMLITPLMSDGEVIGALSVLDRRDGQGYGPRELERARLFAELAVTAITEQRQRRESR
jgi:eukaryotic-like serine/threonine-protein kinase